MPTKILNRQLLVKSIRMENTARQNTQSFCTVVSTNGATAVNVFGSGGAPANLTITGILVIAQDTTAGNITLNTPGGVVATVAKGVTAAVPTGTSAALTFTTVKAGQAVTVLSSSAGNAQVFVFYTFDAE
jgi:hypothetical protein